jgi:hypothetical protein
VIVDAEVAQAIRHGRQVHGPAPGTAGGGHAGGAARGRLARAYDGEGVFIGLLRWDEV